MLKIISRNMLSALNILHYKLNYVDISWLMVSTNNCFFVYNDISLNSNLVLIYLIPNV